MAILPHINKFNCKPTKFYFVKIKQKQYKIYNINASFKSKHIKEIFNKSWKLYPLIYKKIFKSSNKFKKGKIYFYKLLHAQCKYSTVKPTSLHTSFIFSKYNNKFLFKINRKHKRLRFKYILIMQYIKIINNLLSIIKKAFTKLIKKILLKSFNLKSFKQKKKIASKIYQPLKININLIFFKNKKKKNYYYSKKKNTANRSNYKKFSNRHKIHLRWNKKKYEKRSIYKKFLSNPKYTISIKFKKWNKKKHNKIYKKYTKMFYKFKKFYKKEYKLLKKQKKKIIFFKTNKKYNK
jgi:hypothetical protein